MLELYLRSSPCHLDLVNSTTAAFSWSFASNQAFGEERNKEILVYGARL
jgi:hypothetical protein